MKTKICPTCGCALVRLGISEDREVPGSFGGSEYFFCCQGCKDIFLKDPEPFIAEFSDTHVCPTCLAEKPTAQTVLLVHKGQDFRFCRCTHCLIKFKEDPDQFIDRLAGKTDFKGLFAHMEVGCC